MRIYLFIFFIVTVVLGISSYRITNAIFASTATSQNNTFATAEVFPTATPTATLTPTPPEEVALHLVINEVSPLGDTEDEWVELHNPTSNPINLSGWLIEDGGGSDALPSVVIPAGGYGVVITGNSTVDATSSGAVEVRLSGGGSPNSIGSGLNNTGGDEVEIKNSTVSIDAMNYGSVTTFFSGGPGIPDPGTTVSRIPNGTDTDTGSDWQTNTVITIGVTN